MPPRVSVIMPFLNAERFLDEAINSVRAQSFPDWELLLVDDGSNDGGRMIAARHMQADPERVRLLEPDPDRRGAAAARNRGIAAARGSLIAFLDADDLYLPDKLARDVAALEADPESAWAYHATRWFFEDGRQRGWTERLGVRLDRRYDPPELLLRIILEERGDIPCTCGVMIRREAIEAVGGFDERFALYEDQSLWAKLLLGFPVQVRFGCDALYRQHGASTSSSASERGDYDQYRPHRARRVFLEWLRDYPASRKAPQAVRAAIDKAIAESAGGPLSGLRRKLRRAGRFFF